MNIDQLSPGTVAAIHFQAAIVGILMKKAMPITLAQTTAQEIVHDMLQQPFIAATTRAEYATLQAEAFEPALKVTTELVDEAVPHRITRAAAEALLRKHWCATLTPEQLLARNEPEWDRLRNYEYEHKLEEAFGGDWTIDEICPFNGVHCKWGGK